MQAPVHFSDEARKYFDFIVEALEKLERLNETDRPIIEGLAFNLVLIEQSQKSIMKHGPIIEGLHGTKIHPAVEVMNRANQKVNEAYRLLGLDSSMRLKIEKNEEEQQSSFLSSLIRREI